MVFRVRFEGERRPRVKAAVKNGQRQDSRVRSLIGQGAQGQ